MLAETPLLFDNYSHGRPLGYLCLSSEEYDNMVAKTLNGILGIVGYSQWNY